MNDIKEIIKTNEFRILYEANLIDPIALRNLFIRCEYFEIIEKAKLSGGGLKKFDVIQQLADKYNLSFQAIKKILYSSYKRKKVNLACEPLAHIIKT